MSYALGYLITGPSRQLLLSLKIYIPQSLEQIFTATRDKERFETLNFSYMMGYTEEKSHLS